MELLVNPANYSNAIDLIDLGVNSIYVGLKEFSTRNNCVVSFEELKEIVKSKKDTKILVLVNRFFFEPEIEALTTHLKEICRLPIDGIVFNDYAVQQIMFEHNLHKPLIYNSETLVTNYEQFDFYLENNINEVSLARELNVREINEIANKKNKMRIEIQVAGYAFVMHSR
jgi:putative protease